MTTDWQTEWSQTLDKFRIKFIHLLQQEQRNGFRAKVCVLGPEEWYLLTEAAKAECTIKDPRIAIGQSLIEYYGIKCYYGGTGMVFGGDPPK